MRSLFSISLLIGLALSMLNIACAPKDKRFQSKTFINKGEKNTVNTKNKAGSKDKTRTTNTAEANINPSGILESDVYIVVKNLDIQSLGGEDKELEMSVLVNIAVEGSDQKIELARYNLGKHSEKNKNVNFDKEILIERKDINDTIMKLKEISKNSNLVLDISLAKDVIATTEADEDEDEVTYTESKSIANIQLQTKNISNQLKEHKLDSKKENGEELSLNIAIFSQGTYQITEGIIKEKGELVCELNVKSNDNKVNVYNVEINSEGLTSSSVSVSDVTTTVTPPIEEIAVASAHDKNRKTDEILTISARNRNNKSLVTLKEETCKLSKDKEKQISIQLIDISENDAEQLVGCCIEKSKLK